MFGKLLNIAKCGLFSACMMLMFITAARAIEILVADNFIRHSFSYSERSAISSSSAVASVSILTMQIYSDSILDSKVYVLSKKRHMYIKYFIHIGLGYI